MPESFDFDKSHAQRFGSDHVGGVKIGDGAKFTATTNFIRESSDKYASPVDSDAFMAKKEGGGPVKVISTDGKAYTDHKGGINYDVGIIDRSIKMGDQRSGKIVVEQKGSGAREGFSNDGQTVYASGLKRVNTTEQHLNFLEAQSKHSVKKEYSWDVDLNAAEGASVDPEVEKQRQRLAKESAAKKAAEAKRIAKENAAKMKALEKDAVHGKYATIVDDDIMDEAAGRRRLELAALSEKKHREAEEYRISCVQEERARIRSTKSKIHSWNDNWNAQIDQRQSQERELSALLGEIRGRVATGEQHTDREGTHGLEKRLAAAQNWMVSPPTANTIAKGPGAPGSPSSIESFHWQLFGGKQLLPTVGNLFD